MLEAELRIAAEDFPGARNALGDLAETAPSARSLAIMAAIEKGSGADDAVVKGWLARALTSPRGPQWVCDNCHKAHADWSPVCDSCNAFDTLTWRETDEPVASLPSGAEMLPLIVGQIAGPEEVTEPEEAEIIEEDDSPVLEAESDPDTESPQDDTMESANSDAPPVEASVSEKS